MARYLPLDKPCDYNTHVHHVCPECDGTPDGWRPPLHAFWCQTGIDDEVQRQAESVRSVIIKLVEGGAELECDVVLTSLAAAADFGKINLDDPLCRWWRQIAARLSRLVAGRPVPLSRMRGLSILYASQEIANAE